MIMNLLSIYSPGYYLRISSILVAISLIIMYSINQYLHHDGKFPRQTISQVARHYPEYIIFRFVTITNSIFPIWGWITNYFYIKNITRKYQILLLKFYMGQIMLVFGVLGSFFLMCSSAYVDMGFQDNQTHLIYAGLFFICTVTAQVMNTILHIILCFWYQDIQVNRTNTYLKILQVLLIFIQLFVMQNFQLFIKSVPMVAHFVYGRLICTFIEWSITYTILFGYVLISMDLDQLQYVYNTNDFNEQDYETLCNIQKLQWEQFR